MDKYWQTVNTDPSDFTGWTYLLQYVEQEVNYKAICLLLNLNLNFFLIFHSYCLRQQNDIEAAREAYDAFLAHYPYCYGYWRKYADYEKRKGNKKKCEEVSFKKYFTLHFEFFLFFSLILEFKQVMRL